MPVSQETIAAAHHGLQAIQAAMGGAPPPSMTPDPSPIAQQYAHDESEYLPTGLRDAGPLRAKNKERQTRLRRASDMRSARKAGGSTL